jgi:hypothetical protein
MIQKPSSSAALVYALKETDLDGYITEIRIWRLPAKSRERPHGLKYSLFFGRSGERVVGYDNERGKGDHRHYGQREEPYDFETVDKLISDFWNDVTRYKS